MRTLRPEATPGLGWGVVSPIDLWGPGVRDWDARPPTVDTLAGVDEVGRGCLAGPVVAAAVVLPPGAVLQGLADSKVLTPACRERLAAEIRAMAVSWAVASVEADEIDILNIAQATLEAMTRAILQLAPPPELVLIDGLLTPPGLPMPARAIVHGDRDVPVISAASVLAKVARDRIMREWEDRYPGYEFAKHKGYGTMVHRRLIARHGPSPLHRKTFAGVKEYLDGDRQGRLW
ncbi:MAG TPA: ribonuclease HII [Candidatus Sulfotelmatobacter sp.]|nr:ribonuclease HII [Candidatus Sulfotelmatobacter sp.]